VKRTFMIICRFRPEVKEHIEAAIERWIKNNSSVGKSMLTYSDFVRHAVWEACKLPNDPRRP